MPDFIKGLRDIQEKSGAELLVFQRLCDSFSYPMDLVNRRMTLVKSKLVTTNYYLPTSIIFMKK